MSYPTTRMRRLRRSKSMRRLVRDTSICVNNLIYPLFVKPGVNIIEPIESLSGCNYYSADTVVAEAEEVARLGIGAVLLFGQPSGKDSQGSEAFADDGVVQQAVRNIKRAVPDFLVITDVCLCAYTDHGHCGLVKDGRIDNDATCEILAKVALSHAGAGADIVAPSDMMDGRVGIIRQTLEANSFEETAIMSYSAKFASEFYGPFRDVADCSPAFGDRKTYQMDPASFKQPMRQIQMDIEQGADIVMVKPALLFLDVIQRARERFDVPIAAYNVSGEYMMVVEAAKAGVFDKNAAMLEILYSIKRAGADIIITYFAKELAGLLK